MVGDITTAISGDKPPLGAGLYQSLHCDTTRHFIVESNGGIG
jgi:hypothetical protein